MTSGAVASQAGVSPTLLGRNPANMATEEDAIIKTRFLTQTSVSKGEPPLKRLTKRFVQFCDDAENSSAEVAEDALKALLRELGLLEFTSRKMDAICRANNREQQAYSDKRAQLEQDIAKVQLEIEQRKLELAAARISRQHSEEYEVLRHLITEHPSRSSTQNQIDQMKAEISEITQEGTKVALVMARRRKQCALLFHCIEELQNVVGDDTMEDGRVDADTGDTMDVDV